MPELCIDVQKGLESSFHHSFSIHFLKEHFFTKCTKQDSISLKNQRLKDFAKNNTNIQNQQIRQNCQNGQNQFLEIVFIKVYVILNPNMCLYTATQ